MALIALAVYDTEENQRTDYTRRTLESLFETVDLKKHRLVVADNNSCEETKKVLRNLRHEQYAKGIDWGIITLKENIGTAEAINKVWQFRTRGQNAIKMDNDVIIHSNEWVDELEEAIRREPKIGQIGLKRKDLMENPHHADIFYRSELRMLPHERGENWIIVEKCSHIMGTCVMHSSALLDKVGYLKQPTIYGFDDSLMSMRSRMAGFMNVFLPHIVIDHIDVGNSDYTTWKQNHASEFFKDYTKIADEYKTGKRPIYYNPYE